MTTRTLFITGTDTGVGKTTIACALIHAARERGLRVAVQKPAESGCAPGSAPADAEALRVAAGLDASLAELICPFRYLAPVAPAVAARREGPPFSLATVLVARAALVDRVTPDLLVVEGAGGLLVPYADHVDGADLARAYGAELVVVARAGLGTINHTALTVEAARRRSLVVLGIILSRTVREADASEPDNAHEIARLTGSRVLGTMPHSAAAPRDLFDALF